MTTQPQTPILKHAPEPYHIAYDTEGVDDVLFIVAADGSHLSHHQFFSTNRLIPEELMATFTLFAAAPELLARLQQALAAIDTLVTKGQIEPSLQASNDGWKLLNELQKISLAVSDLPFAEYVT